MDFVRITGVKVKQNEAEFWKITPFIRYEVKSPKLINIIYEFGNKNIPIQKEFEIIPDDSSTKEHLEIRAEIFKESLLIGSRSNGSVEIRVYMDNELNSIFKFLFTSYLAKNRGMEIRS